MTIDRRFALLASDGAILYPFITLERSSGREGFAISEPGRRNAQGLGTYTMELEQVVRRVVHDGWRVRAKTAPPQAPRSASYALGKRSIHQFWIAPELAPWVESAPALRQHGDSPVALDIPTAASALSPAAAWPFSDGSMMDEVDEAAFASALQTLAPGLCVSDRAMLVGHAQAAARTLPPAAIAAHGGCDTVQQAGAAYAAIGAKLAASLGVEGLEEPILAIASETDMRDEDGQLIFEMREPLARALHNLGWADAVDLMAVDAAAATIDSDPASADVTPTIRQALVNARIGQGLYRQRMLDLWGSQCAVTGCSLTAVLVASHAKPWAQATNAERLDEYNGLLLSAALDRLFDRGLIAFADEGRMLCKPEVDLTELQRLGIPADARLRLVHDRHKTYLAAHREAAGFA